VIAGGAAQLGRQTVIQRLAFLGFGEAARAFWDSLRDTDAKPSFEAHDL
jgi:hypothetical protein